MDVEVSHLGRVFDGKLDTLMTYLGEAGYDLKERNPVDAFFVKRKKEAAAPAATAAAATGE